MSPLKHSNNFAARMGRWSANHWKTAVFGWLAFVVASFAIGMTVGTKYLETTDRNVGEAAKADQIVKEGFEVKVDEMGEMVFVQNKKLDAHDPAFKSAIADIARTLDRFPQVTKIQSPLAPSHANQISKDGHSVMITFVPKGDFVQASLYIDKITAAVDKAETRHPGFYVEEIGSVSTEEAQRDLQQPAREGRHDRAPAHADHPAVRVRLRSAALVPLLLALTAVMATIQLVSIPSQLFPVDEQIAEVILLIGLAVGVDYSLFYFRREREERRAGRSERAALEAAAATSGRAVLISGFTVMIAMAGMFFSGDKTFMSFSRRDDDGRRRRDDRLADRAAGAARRRLGDKIEKGKIPFLHRLRRNATARAASGSAVLDRVAAPPGPLAVAAAAVLLALTIPAFSCTHAQTGIEDVRHPRGRAAPARSRRVPGRQRAGPSSRSRRQRRRPPRAGGDRRT